MSRPSRTAIAPAGIAAALLVGLPLLPLLVRDRITASRAAAAGANG